MTAKTRVEDQTIAGAQPYATGHVTSRDGTSIGYRRLGHGPGLVLVQGAMGSAHNFMELARALADSFTVYVPDRRGRGSSGPYGHDYGTRKEVEDLDALVAETGARDVFGLSAGALIALQAALTLPVIQRIALFEPALFLNGSAPSAMLARYEKEMARGKVAAALVTAMKAAQMGPPIFGAIPHRLLELLTNLALAQEDRNLSAEYLPMRALAPTLHYDFQVVLEMSEALESFRAINAEVLLLGGSKSPAYLKVALDALEKVLPQVSRIEFAGLDHGAPWNSDRGGRPEPVAIELRRFFAD